MDSEKPIAVSQPQSCRQAPPAKGKPSADRPDTLVLGGGPAGAAAALQLARAGQHVTLIERETAPRHKVCGEFLSEEALQLLSLLRVPLHHLHASESGDAADASPRGAVPVHGVRLAYRDGVATAELPFRASSLTRRRLDPLLLGAAEAAGVCILRTTAEQMHYARGQWQVTLQTGETVCAPQVVLATGKHDLRGFARPRGTQNDLVALKSYFRLRPEQAESLAGHVELLLHPAGYTGLQSVEGGAANLTALVRRSHLARLGGWTGLLKELCRTNRHAAQRLEGARNLLDKPLAIASLPYGFVRAGALAPGLWAVGDQAAVIPSFTGDGMSIALYSGLRAAEGLLRGECAEEFQPALHRVLHSQVARATALSRLLVHGPSQAALATAARVWPGALRQVAASTRLPLTALHALQTAAAKARPLALHFGAAK